MADTKAPSDTAAPSEPADSRPHGRRARAADARPRLRFSRLPVLEGTDLTTRHLALFEARSRRPGKAVWLTAGIHGDEVGGMVVVQEIFRRLRKRPLTAGRLSAFPLLNPFGFDALARRIPSTEEDLNRSFPGDPHGTFAERIAHLVHARITADEPALVIDLHNDWIRSVPYALLDPRPRSDAGRAAHKAARAAAASSGLPTVDEQEEGISRAVLRSTLSGCLMEAGVPSLTLEVGGAHVVDESDVEIGVTAVWRVLASLGLVEAEAESGKATEARATLRRYSHRPYPSRAGIVRFRVKPGEPIAAGTTVAVIQDLFGRTLEVLRAEHAGIVLGHADSSIAVPGTALVAMAIDR